MNTIAYLLILTSLLLVRGMTKARTVEDLPQDLGDFFVGMVGMDTAAMREVLNRTGPSNAVHTENIPGEGKILATTSANGRLTDAELVRLSFSTESLAPGPAADLERLNIAYRDAFGTSLTVTDGYRTYDSQVALRASKGRFAATPGTSKHGLGRAVDLGGGVQTWGSAQRNWMVAHAPAYGWTSPAWAQLGNSTPEPWHWEHA